MSKVIGRKLSNEHYIPKTAVTAVTAMILVMSDETKPVEYVIGRELMRFGRGTQTLQLDATATLDLSRQSSLSITAGPLAPGSLGPQHPFSSEEYSLLLDNSTSVPLIGCEDGDSDGTVKLKLNPLQTPIRVDRGKGGKYATFGVVNFSSFYNRIPEQTAVKKDELELRGGGWILKLSPWLPTLNGDASAAEGPLYHVTHAARIEREDGHTFTSEELESCLFWISRFFSFASARAVSTVFAKSFDGEGNVVTEWWGTGPLDAETSVSTWMDSSNAQELNSCFSGFMQRGQDPEWRSTIQAAIYWYLRSARSETGIDGNLVLIQAGLERLSWQMLNKDKRFLLEKLDRLPAADQLRLLLGLSGISLSIPMALTGIVEAAKAFNWKDGPQAIVETRNRIVHPPIKASSFPSREALYQTWLLALWYLELVLLRISDFRGSCVNRTNGMKIAPVPW